MLAFVQFRHYLLGRQFIIRSDNPSFRWLMSFKNLTDQLAGGLENPSQFDFKLYHRKGKSHVNADVWSPVSCDPQECACYNGKLNTILEGPPCGGCKNCCKRHDQSSVVRDFDDVVLLFMRSLSVSVRNEMDRRESKGLQSGFLVFLCTLLMAVINVLGILRERHRVWWCLKMLLKT